MVGSDLGVTEPWVACGPRHSDCPGTPMLGDLVTSFPTEVPRRTQGGAGEDAWACARGGILQRPGKQNLLKEWSCVIRIIDSERVNTFMDKGGSV